MNEIEHRKTKIYYSMGEVAEMFDVNPSLIRFWEQKFDVLRPHKNKKGNRMFTPEDVENLKIIYHLVKEKGMTLSGAAQRIKDNKEGVQRNMEIVERLLGVKSILMEIRQELKEGGGVVESDDIDAESEDVSCVHDNSQEEFTTRNEEESECEQESKGDLIDVQQWDNDPVSEQIEFEPELESESESESQMDQEDEQASQEYCDDYEQYPYYDKEGEFEQEQAFEPAPEQREPEQPMPRIVEQTLF